MKNRTVLITLIVSMLAVSGTFLARGVTSDKPEAGQPSKQKQPPVVEVVSASKATLSLGLALTGSVDPYRVARLASPAEGPVLGIRVREGDHVKTGDELLSVGRKKGIDALIASLREELKKEEYNLSRTRQLVDGEALPGEQLDQARAACENVRAQLIHAEETAQDHTITAPWEGVVSGLLVKEGEFVAPRAALLEMYDPSSLVIRAAVPEKYTADIAADMPVDVRLDAYPDGVLKGRVERVYPYLDPRLRTRTMEIVLDKSVHLLPGMFARLRVLLKTVSEAVVVPSEALVLTPKGRVVFVVEDGKAIGRPVETGIEEGNRIQIIAGVVPGDKVVVAGNEKLKDGAAVSLSGSEKSGKGKLRNMAEPPAGEKIKAGGDAK
ncbi:MAG: efflux RND transporter periplasmic adaptor subunit [Deltaproteobacteria bacterium]|nr:efflux RND transporter periplasmic adaptor subunit [Deltaproteobacteria bacterium]